MSVIKVVTTLPNSLKEFEVGEWSYALLSEKIVGCIQIEKIKSIFSWEGKINSVEEWKMTLTTKLSLIDQIIEAIHATHPYDVPQIVWHTVNTSQNYEDWINEVTMDE
ncbi:MAG: divalent-cation tolerance protein CutA [Euryarchaeota archaeon]|nr:divalent-cation tolerance protein CutA [Euryarchaeota archaeon]|tara:strand:+ start:120 stop:443 length:324 start_codon:yes stop_codon:yes gene_type:complete